ncbi:MAG: FAD-binding and (Fe-S)-binding domain-containing protein [Actinomycetia bacterium]|nr:FAD-binding and (Fe-S)-binding domain-containing protein [Actinomycetes bacterium]
MRPPAAQRVEELVHELARRGVREVSTDQTLRSAYSFDASLYRIRPAAVVRPRAVEEIAEIASVCAGLGLPITARGGGTSIAGNAVGAGVIVDYSRHLNGVLEVDAEQRLARVEPGAVHATLQQAARRVGLRYGPDPSSHSRCTIGGMIGNNACGTRALGYGRTSDNLAEVSMVLADGSSVVLRRGQRRESVRAAVPALDVACAGIDGALATVRTEFARFGRQVSGYALEHLLPERFDAAAFIAGTEGTLGLLTSAVVDLVPDPAASVLVVLGFGSIGEAGDAVPEVLRWSPRACEGIDRRIVDVVRERFGPLAVPELPAGASWLFIELAGENVADVADEGERLVAELGVPGRVVTDELDATALWRIREDGAGLSSTSPRGRPAHAGWEDAAVPPQRLGAYLRDFDDLLAEHDLTGLPYGHFGDGCLHIRIDVPLDGSSAYRSFVEAAADLVVSYGGSLSGEHGDGRARSELLSRMYSPDAIALMAMVKDAFDPGALLNPGVLVEPAPLDADLALQSPSRAGLDGAFRCTGVGRCRADHAGADLVMCPSYLATREEVDSTRGRARVLQDAITGRLPSGVADPAVAEALELCLSCKGCHSDCPTGVDMATYKSLALEQRYATERRPMSHHLLGALPRWLAVLDRAPRLLSPIARMGRAVAQGNRVVAKLAGIDVRRSLPAPAAARQRLDRAGWAAGHGGAGAPVVVFVDTFTEAFAPHVAEAAARVLTDAGYAVRFTHQGGCCGLTWISTGQRAEARSRVGDLVQRLAPAAQEGIPIVGLEPSCTAVLRQDALDLLEGTDLHGAATAVAGATHTLAELLEETEGWQPPDLGGLEVIAQPHCHQHAVMGFVADLKILEKSGAQVTRLSGCCGMAGNFGMEAGHYEVSVAVAEQQLLPALREHEGAILLADGFSCRTQARDLAGRQGTHLAELLARDLAPVP